MNCSFAIIIGHNYNTSYIKTYPKLRNVPLCPCSSEVLQQHRAVNIVNIVILLMLTAPNPKRSKNEPSSLYISTYICNVIHHLQPSTPCKHMQYICSRKIMYDHSPSVQLVTISLGKLWNHTVSLFGPLISWHVEKTAQIFPISEISHSLQPTVQCMCYPVGESASNPSE